MTINARKNQTFLGFDRENQAASMNAGMQQLTTGQAGKCL
jgi:hypothetical protein